MTGTLYLVPTPIGNLEDMTLRAIRVLREVACIACEDTRTSKVLLSHYDIKTQLISYHKFNERERAEALLARLLAGEDIALITDAGMPGISDPGEIMVRAAIDAGVQVSALPGPSALVTALAVSGQDSTAFVFEGFLPGQKKARQEKLTELAGETRTVILYEAPHRLMKTLEELAATFGGARSITLCRELSKKFETVTKTSIAEALAAAEETSPRGEYVLVIAGKDKAEALSEAQARFAAMTLTEHMALYLSQGMHEKDAMRAVAKDRGLSRRDVYQALLKDKDQSST